MPRVREVGADKSDSMPAAIPCFRGGRRPGVHCSEPAQSQDADGQAGLCPAGRNIRQPDGLRRAFACGTAAVYAEPPWRNRSGFMPNRPASPASHISAGPSGSGISRTSRALRALFRATGSRRDGMMPRKFVGSDRALVQGRNEAADGERALPNTSFSGAASWRKLPAGAWSRPSGRVRGFNS